MNSSLGDDPHFVRVNQVFALNGKGIAKKASRFEWFNIQHAVVDPVSNFERMSSLRSKALFQSENERTYGFCSISRRASRFGKALRSQKVESLALRILLERRKAEPQVLWLRLSLQRYGQR